MSEQDLRATFDAVASQYADVRPGYPDELFDELVAVTGIGPDSELLEIGPGTGQATVPLAARGFAITAVELGGAMARLARKNLAAYPRAHVVQAPVEDADLPLHAFDLVYAATSLHWVPEAVRSRRPHDLLRQGGHLAAIYSEHVSDESGDAFFLASQEIYRTATEQPHPRADAHGGSPDDEPRLPRVSDLRPEHLDPDLFEPVGFRVFPIVIRYSAERFAGLVDTFSTTRALPPQARAERLVGLRRLIDHDFGGHLDLRFAMTLTVARAR
ncbi:class I SAM-dependent methyltransferase [Angustibacter sp. McL0619]|uniref:class I SAM-dependent methyltransferase n=1 Tax=Angustibacter sp. McL0619 TaxID=3415676 RepID=UPI003CF4DC4C